jgi:predicted  nucleic acid-binding Zn-ribbon protein
MMSEVQRLREQADRFHRLARTIFDEQMVKALREYAAEAEQEAAVLEAGLRRLAMFEAASAIIVPVIE